MTSTRLWMALLATCALGLGCATAATGARPEARTAGSASPSPRVQGATPPEEHPQNEMTNPAD